jgi:hypothetical protein
MQEKRPWIVTFGPWIGAILAYIVISQAVGYITDTQSQIRREAREQQTAEFLAGEAQDEVDADAAPAGTEVDLGEEVVEEVDLEDEAESANDEAVEDEATPDEPANDEAANGEPDNGEPTEGDTATDDTAADDTANGEEPDSGDAESEDVNGEETDGEETEADAS